MAKKKIGVTLDETLHAQIKSAAPMRGTNLEGAYDEALRAWLGEKSTEGRVSREYQRYIEALLWLLDNPSPVTDAAKGILKPYLDRKREKRSEQAPHRKTGT